MADNVRRHAHFLPFYIYQQGVIQMWYQDIFAKSEAKIEATCKRIGNKIPYIPENGHYTDKGDDMVAWWTNGFWGGILWQLYNATKKDLYRQTANNLEDRLDYALDEFSLLHHDVGFLYLHTAVANLKQTGHEPSRKRGLHAANILAGRYNPNHKYILAWDYEHKGWMIIDTMMNLPLLHWAAKELGRPFYSSIANNHADTVMEMLLRPDGSCNHMVVLDQETGELVETPGGQGYESGSSWSRGLAWALYGFYLSYHHTNEKRYLDAAKRVAHYFISCAAKTGYVALCDFRAPAEPVLYDTTASAIAACGLLAIANVVGEHEKALYHDAAVEMLKALADKHANFDTSTDSIISHGTTAYHDIPGHHVPLIYGDYFFIEGLMRLMSTDTMLW